MSKRVKEFLSGILLGIANLIPGVSAGTMAVILGIYDELINAISNFFSEPHSRRDKLTFLVFISAGFIVSLITFSKVLSAIMGSYPQPTYLFFIGLIIGSLPIIYKSHEHMSPNIPKLSLFVLGLGVMLWISFGFPGHGSFATTQNVEMTAMTLLILGISGFIAAGTMIIPGISGSLLLLLMGSYFIILDAIATFKLPILIAVGIGAVLGVLSLSKVMNWCLRHYPAESYYMILGLMIGSLAKLWPGLQANLMGGLSIGLAVLGAVMAWQLSRIRR